MIVARNRKAFYDYFIEEKLEAGMVLMGWEVKAIKAGRAQLCDSYVIFKGMQLFLLGGHITPLVSASTCAEDDRARAKKLLLHCHQLRKLFNKVKKGGYTLVPIDFHLSKRFVKVEIALAKGKKSYDKRATDKEKDWARERQRLLGNRPSPMF